MLLSTKTYQEQASLSQYCRTGNIDLVGSVDIQRVGHYRRLVFNVVKESLNAAYPLTRNLINKEEWDTLIEVFFSNHACQSNQLWKMPEELHKYVTDTQHPLIQKYFLLEELLWFEWLEIQLYMQDDIVSAFSTEGNIKTDKLIINPELKLQAFKYPVHLKKAKDIRIEEASDYYLSLHRHPNSGKILFTNLSPAYVRIIELLNESAKSIEELTRIITRDFGISKINEAHTAILNFVNTAIENKQILGFIKN